jgi:hypothetical protein
MYAMVKRSRSPPVSQWKNYLYRHIGSFPPDKDGNIYIIVMIDCFSDTLSFPAADCTADAAAKAIVHHFKLFESQNPTVRQRHTVRKSVINELSKLVELSLEKSTAYSHEENGSRAR